MNNKSKEEEISLLNINRLDYLPFFAAILYDRRSLLTMFIKILLQKVFLFRSLCAMSPFDMRTVNCSIYFLFIVLIFTFNALFFSNEMIVNQFPSDAFKRGTYALLPSAAIYLFLWMFFLFIRFLKALYQMSQTERRRIVMIKKTLHRVKRKVVLCI